jgi:hypothetical protein
MGDGPRRGAGKTRAGAETGARSVAGGAHQPFRVNSRLRSK